MDWHGDDIEPEDLQAETTDESVDAKAEEKIAKMRDELSTARKEKQEYLDGWQRAKADYVNALKRFDEEKKKERERGVVIAAEALLPAFDALERAKEHGDLPEGFAGIVKQLESGFASLGLEAFGEAGEEFDPAQHEALGQDEAKSEQEDNTVSAVLGRGWKIGGAVIRPAKVRVAQFAK
jgi:molecular chaperone GrpE